jgi:eukaryotic-like serine/threonine-protein kinase
MPESSEINWNNFIGKDVANVTLIKELGRGTMGVVFIGFQKSLKRQVAVKILHKSAIHSDVALQSFRDEGEALGVLSHPHIVPIYEMGQTDDCFFQVMQLVDGSDLRSIIKNALKHPVPAKRVMPLNETIEIILRTLDGLSYAHEQGIIHQDIKPANILIEHRDKRPLIADFGIARIIGAEYLAQNKIVGTPLYMSPEQAAGKSTDQKTDIYSIGVILFEMLVGTLPIKNEAITELLDRKKFAPETFFTAMPSHVSSFINQTMERIVLKAIEPNKERRYGSCEEFIDDLKNYRLNFLPRS